MEIFANVQRTMAEALEKAEAALGVKPVVKGLGITNQRETAVAWSKTTGKPLTNAVVWMDTRTKCAKAAGSQRGLASSAIQFVFRRSPSFTAVHFVPFCRDICDRITSQLGNKARIDPLLCVCAACVCAAAARRQSHLTFHPHLRPHARTPSGKSRACPSPPTSPPSSGGG